MTLALHETAILQSSYEASLMKTINSFSPGSQIPLGKASKIFPLSYRIEQLLLAEILRGSFFLQDS